MGSVSSGLLEEVFQRLLEVKDILESSGNVTRAFVQSFLPIDVMGGWKEFVPSSVKPLVEVATNEAWYDAPIAPDQPAYQPKIPEKVKDTLRQLLICQNHYLLGLIL